MVVQTVGLPKGDNVVTKPASGLAQLTPGLSFPVIVAFLWRVVNDWLEPVEWEQHTIVDEADSTTQNAGLHLAASQPAP